MPVSCLGFGLVLHDLLVLISSGAGVSARGLSHRPGHQVGGQQVDQRGRAGLGEAMCEAKSGG